MNLVLSSMIISGGLLAALAAFALAYWWHKAPRYRQWLRLNLGLSLGWALLAMWLLDSHYQMPTSWLGRVLGWGELWLLLSLSLSFVATAWLQLPRLKPLSRPLAIDPLFYGLSLLLLVASALLGEFADLWPSIGVMTMAGLLGIWLTRNHWALLLSAIICSIGSVALVSLLSFGLPLIWPELAGFEVAGWWSVLDVPTLALAALVALAVGPVSWRSLGQAT